MKKSTYYIIIASIVVVLLGIGFGAYKYLSKNSSTVKSETGEIIAKIPEPEYVDLGLSCKWSTTNVGAAWPWEAGNFYAWGEINPKQSFESENYRFYSTKIYSRAATLRDEDDVAKVAWGKGWHIPTAHQFHELETECQWTWTDNYKSEGAAGYIVTGKNGKSIFLPAAGYRTKSSCYKNEMGAYWTRVCRDDGIARYFSMGKEAYRLSGNNRYYGFTIRPVFDVN